MSKDEILQNHHSVMMTFGISLAEEDIDLPKLYWIPKLHKNPYKQRYIAGSAKCSTKPLSQILTRILTTVKDGLQKYCDTAYARSGVNQMWILKNSKEILENLKAQSLHSVNSIKSFDFSTLYTTIPHDKLKSKLKEIINQCFFHKNGNRRFQYVVIGYKKGKRKVQGVPQSQTAALPRPQEEEETDKSKQAQTEQTYEKH